MGWEVGTAVPAGREAREARTADIAEVMAMAEDQNNPAGAVEVGVEAPTMEVGTVEANLVKGNVLATMQAAAPVEYTMVA
eukprot:7016190-Prymnesium_polylepis.2